MINKRLTAWHWGAIIFSIISLVVMLRITTQLMPSEEKADSILFIKALGVVQKIDPLAKNIYISDLIDKYTLHNGQRVGYLDAVEAIAKDYPSPEFKQELNRLKIERDSYLKDLRSDQIDAISSTIVMWFLFMALLNGGGVIVIRLIKWGICKAKNARGTQK